MLYWQHKTNYGHVLKGCYSLYQINNSHTNGAGCYIIGAGCYSSINLMQLNKTTLFIAAICNAYHTL